MTVFDVINNLTASKEYIYTKELEKDIVPFMINRAMANFYDCVFYANELNKCKNLTKKQVYDFYHFGIQPKKKRFAKWGSPKKDETVMLITEYYKCNVKVAEQYLKFMSDADIASIREKLDKGGSRK